ncbi:hypothetical protein EMPS_11566 [Entomortierella parvispora]|uniref:Protein MGR2 n=1 Tax=Entomortierella parvispora TaxID=205924 RepID=A0A9P3M2M2_9FUNG|nr:hypothetical protein EMPS_11566 [Entomortierella parvispora]
MEPTKFERAKVGAMMGGAVGLCIGLVFGGISAMRNGPGSRGYVNNLAQTMLSSTATFAFFMAIGSVIRSEEAKAIDYSSLEFNNSKRFKTPPVIILQQQRDSDSRR